MKLMSMGGAPLHIRPVLTLMDISIMISYDDVKFTVDLVPAFKFDLTELKIACQDLHQRVTEIAKEQNIIKESEVK